MAVCETKGLVRGTVDVMRHQAVSPQGVSLFQKLMPDYAQLVAEGRVWRAQEAAATASVTALPTTASLFTLGNNEPDDGLWYVVLAVYAFNSANAAAIDYFSLAACVSQLPALTGGTDPTLAQDIAKTSIKNMLGVRGGGYNGRAVIDTGVTITDDLWFPLGNGSGSTGIASATGAAVWHWVNGLIILPPKAILGMVSTATSASNTTRKGVIWTEARKEMLLGA